MKAFDYKAIFRPKKPQAKLIQYPHTTGPINIAVADGVVSDVIQKKIKDGRYEKHEARTIPKLMIDDEILLELGAGVGVISTLGWLSGKVREVHCFEADPRLIELIKETHTQNGVKGYVYNQILSSDADLVAQGLMDFHIREHFYGNSTITSVGREVKETVKVPVVAITEAISKIQPTVIACDIEGGELGLFDEVEMPSVKTIMLETHQAALKGHGMRQVFHEMHKADFHYDERYSCGSVSVFSRIY
ncbi:FkbM family methyltransferase [Rhizobium mongolense]|uniref:FkbM family methyltransferase n=1 Tax=Rhizobium mongolense TaxID=57676 RepID=A0A7W6RXA8_9HYPH|nr:FkbM family methyltransferase [Rhizobium mongolense]MBB4279663.1 FkbM family methyltransferase [Rhizobium mongolense]